MTRRAHIATFWALLFLIVGAAALEGRIILEALREVWAAESHSY